MRYILMLLGLLYWGQVALAGKKPYILATALYYNNEKGHQILTAGHIPKIVKKAIKRFIRKGVGNAGAEVRVVPFLYRVKRKLAAGEIVDIQSKYKHVYFASIPKPKAVEKVYAKSNKMEKKMEKWNGMWKSNGSKLNEVKTNMTSDYKSQTKPMPDSNIPNTVYFTVQNMCGDPTNHTCFTIKEKVIT